jgi:hypothetical protein
MCPFVNGCPPQKAHVPAGFDMAKVSKSEDDLNKTKGLMRALLGMKPKPHEDMKLGKRKRKKKKTNPKPL